MTELLNQRYQIIHSIAESNDAAVYEAFDVASSRPVLIKAYGPEFLRDWKRFQLIEREAKILAQLNHLEIPSFIDFFTQDLPKGQYLYLVTQWMQGQTLAQKKSGTWNPGMAEILKIAEMSLQILAYLHHFNPPIVHRDIKPSNLMMSPHGRIFLIDFGGVQEALSSQGAGGSTLVGTLGYMAPEQIQGRAEPASDLYALGISLLQILTEIELEKIPFKQDVLDFEAFPDNAARFFKYQDQKTLEWWQAMTAQKLEKRYESAKDALWGVDILLNQDPFKRELFLPENIKSQIPEMIHALSLIERSDTALQIQAKSLLAGRYEILETLGSGTHSCVYKGLNKSTGKHLIIKELRFQEIQSWKSLELFEREIEVLRSLKHPRIPAFVDAFQLDWGGHRSWFLISQYLEAQTLEQRLQEGWRPTDEMIWDIAKQLLEILQDLHQRSVPLIHRDIKPSNILINSEQQLYLIDFGSVQKQLAMEGTGGSTIIGTWGYMAPEQFAGQFSVASDLYALGACLVRLLANKHPIEIPLGPMGLQFEGFVRCPDFLLHWLKHLIHPDPQARFQSCSEALTLLEDHLQAGEKAKNWLKTVQSNTVVIAEEYKRSRMIPRRMKLNQLPEFSDDQFPIQFNEKQAVIPIPEHTGLTTFMTLLRPFSHRTSKDMLAMVTFFPAFYGTVCLFLAMQYQWGLLAAGSFGSVVLFIFILNILSKTGLGLPLSTFLDGFNSDTLAQPAMASVVDKGQFVLSENALSLELTRGRYRHQNKRLTLSYKELQRVEMSPLPRMQLKAFRFYFRSPKESKVYDFLKKEYTTKMITSETIYVPMDQARAEYYVQILNALITNAQ